MIGYILLAVFIIGVLIVNIRISAGKYYKDKLDDMNRGFKEKEE